MAVAQTEPPGAAAPPAAHQPAATTQRPRGPLGPQLARALAGRQWWITLLLAGLLCFVTFFAKGGLSLESMSAAEMALTLLAGVLVAGALVGAGRVRHGPGLWSVGMLLAFTALAAVSIVWSVAPAASWQDAGRMLAYSAVFGAAVTFVRVAPERWPAVLGGVTLAAVVVCTYALLTKVFPGSLAGSDTFARLEAPFGYWNATGLMAAMGAVGCLWLGARRSGHALLSALAYPGMGIALVTLALAYSRGALAALAVGGGLWFLVVPLRLRGAVVLLAGALAATGVAAYDFSTHALSSDNIAIAERTSAGHRLGALLLAMVLVLAAAGMAIGFVTGRRAPSLLARRRAGAVLLALIAAGVLAFAAALAHSHRGFTGSISHAVDSVTNPNARTPPNTPDRLTAVASVRARYWKEALEVFAAHPALGAGAMGYQTARLRYRKAPLVVAHAHGFVVQTLADLGLVGLAVALALLACWMAAAGTATHPFNRRWGPWRSWLSLRDRSLRRRPLRGGSPGGPLRLRAEEPGWRALPRPERAYTPERVGLLTMLCIVVTFGAHSLVDWTWYVPGVACTALICAGWLAGRGPLAAHAAGSPGPSARAAAGVRMQPAGPQQRFALRRPGMREVGPVRLAVAAAVIAGALLAAWSQWQPQRSEDARQQALEQLGRDRAGALASAKLAVSRDPLSPLALFTLADVQQALGRPAQARATLQRAVREQPSNPQTWLTLARYDLAREPAAALHELQAAIYLDPESIAPELLTPQRKDREAIEIYNDYVQALRAVAAGGGTGRVSTGGAAPAPAAAGARARHRHAAPRRTRSGSPRAKH